MRLHFTAHPVLQGLQPLHFVGELLTVRRLPVDKVAIDQPQRAERCVERAGNHARLRVLRARHVAHHIAQRAAAQDGDAVVGLLAKRGGFVACILQCIKRKLVVGELELLQAQGIDRIGGQPGEHLGQAYGQGVDVPGGNLHGRFGTVARLARRSVTTAASSTVSACPPLSHSHLLCVAFGYGRMGWA